MSTLRRRATAVSLAAVAATVVLSGCSAPSSASSDSGLPALLQQAVDSGSLTVGTSVNAPIAYIDSSSGKLEGVTADVMRAYLQRKGVADEVKLKTETMDFSSLIPALQTKRISFIIDSMFVTEERKRVVSFTDPVFYNPEALIVPKGNPADLSTLKGLCGKTAGSYEGSAFLAQLTTASEACGSDPIDVKTYPKVEDVINDTAAGRLDAGLIDATVAAYGISKNPKLGIEISEDYEPADKSATAAANAVLPGNDDFVKDYDAELEGMRKDGTLAKIFEENGLTPTDYFLQP